MYVDYGIAIDITKIQAKLWFLYQAKAFIDFGYKALHMGQHELYGKHDDGFVHLYDLLTAIRLYANSIGSFVILNGENLEHETARLNDSDTLLFDFEAKAMRPREISEPPVSGDVEGCDSPVDTTLFNGTPCEDEDHMAFIDPCVIQGGPMNPLSSGGIHPLGCMVEQQPYLIYFDFGPGAAYYNTTVNGEPCKTLAQDSIFIPRVNYPPNGGSKLVWGFDDQRWFADVISSKCREWWFNNYYCEQRNFHNGHGFIQIPGLLQIGKPEHGCQAIINAIDSTKYPASGALFIMADEDSLLASVVNMLTPKPAQMKITSHCDIIDPNCHFMCEDKIAPLGYQYKTWIKWFKFELDSEPDCSSTYSWHIYGPIGEGLNPEWLPLTFGPERIFYPEVAGDYKVYLRQDNYGFNFTDDPDRNGVIQAEETISVEKVVCNCFLTPQKNCPEPVYRLTSQCLSSNETKAVYNYSLTLYEFLASHIISIHPVKGNIRLKQTEIKDLTVNGYFEDIGHFNSKIEVVVQYLDHQHKEQKLMISEHLVPCESIPAKKTSSAWAKDVTKERLRKLKIYPNPSKYIINLSYEFKAGQLYSVNLVDLLGREISVHQLNEPNLGNTQTIKFERGLQSGIYWIVLKVNDIPIEQAKIMIE